MKNHLFPRPRICRPASRRRVTTRRRFHTVTAGGALLLLLGLLLGTPRAFAQTDTLGTTNLLEGPAAGADSVVLGVTPTAATWTASPNATWLHLDAADSSGVGSTNVVFTFDANSGATRVGTLTVAGQTLTVTQAGATYVAANPFTTLVSSGLISPRGVAVDGAGNVYIADQATTFIKKWTAATGTVTTLVSGLSSPTGVAVDGAGNVYFSDSVNKAIYEWTAASGKVTTLVSSGLNEPLGVAVDGAGNVYFSDAGNKAIYEWTAATGKVTTLVSSGLGGPLGVAVDGAGNVYIADVYNAAIYEWTAANGTLTTLVSGLSYAFGVAVDSAGNVYIAASFNGVYEWTAATGKATTLVSSGLSKPWGVAVDGAGHVYIADNGNAAIEELPNAFVDPTARAETAVAGSDVLPAALPVTENLLAPVFAPTSDQSWVTITGVTNGVVSFAFTANASVSRTAKISLLGTNIAITQAGAITAALGTNSLVEGPAAGSDGVGLTVSSPSGPWTATANAVWLHLSAANQSSTGSATVAFTFDANPGSPRTGTLTIAGQTLNVIQFGGNGLGTTNLLEGPAADTDSVVLAFWASPGLWTATANAVWLHLNAANQGGTGSTNVIFTFDANPGATRTGTLTVAGMTLAVTQAGSTYAAAKPFTTLVTSGLSVPKGVAVDGAGNVYIADSGNNVIEEWLAASNQMITLPISGLSAPRGVVVDGGGNVYISDTGHNAIKEWSPATGALNTLVSTGLNTPYGVALDAAGNVYIADGGDNAIKEWTAANQSLTTLPVQGLSSPYGVAVDRAGNVYIGDSGNNAIKEWQAASGTVTTLVSSGLNTPRCVAVDGAGNVYVADLDDNAIKVWNAASGLVTMLVSQASGLGGTPFGVAVDSGGNVYFSDQTKKAIEELPRAFVDPTTETEPVAAGGDALPMVLPATKNLLPPFAPTSDESWLTISVVANGVVSYAFTTNATLANRTAHITLLGQSITITQAGAAAPTLTSPTWLPGGSFQFRFTGTAGASYSVWFSTNLALPLSAWTAAGSATVVTPGQFQFKVTPAPGTPGGFYSVRSP